MFIVSVKCKPLKIAKEWIISESFYSKLIKNEKLTFPLYHGTSSIFCESIEKYGLGGRNPINELDVLDAYRILYNVADQKYPYIWDYDCVSRNVSKAMVAQRVPSQNMNFRHGSVYLTTSKCNAKGYANSNKYGSELISNAIVLLNLLVHEGWNDDVESLAGIKSISAIKDAVPLILEVNNIDLRDLKCERGGNDVRSAVKEHCDFFDQTGCGTIDSISQMQMAFEMDQLVSIPWSHIKVLH
jgi:hypothetical protein